MTRNRILSRVKGAPSAFTLVEMLTLLGVVAILVSLLFPIFTSTVNSANSAKCLGNLRTIYPAIEAYANDNRNYLPPYSTSQVTGANIPGSADLAWYQLLLAGGYLDSQKVLVCPATAKALRSPYPNYGMNIALTVNYMEPTNPQGTDFYRFPANLLEIATPSKTVLLADAATYQGNGVYSAPACICYPSPQDQMLYPVHGNSTVNILWIDGHAAPFAAPDRKDPASLYLPMNQGGLGKWYTMPTSWIR